MRDTQIKIYFADRDDPKSIAHVTSIRCPKTIKIVIGTDSDELEIKVNDNGKLDDESL